MTTTQIAAPTTWAPAFAAMVEAYGRQVDGQWLGSRSHATASCVETNHDWCHGWVAPRVVVRKCVCPCHDSARPRYRDARAAAL